MWQILFCFIVVANAAPDFSLEDSDDYYFRHRFIPQVATQYHFPSARLVRALPVLRSFSGNQAVGGEPRVDVTHVKNHAKSQPSRATFYRKADFDFDDDDDDVVYFRNTGGSPTFYKVDDDDDDRRFFNRANRFRSLPTPYSGGRLRFYDDDIFDFDDK